MDPDRRLMMKVQRHDPEAFRSLVERFGTRLYSAALRILGSHQDAEDAVQRTFLSCYAGSDGYRTEWAASTWLYRILTNQCVDELRRRAARERRDQAAADLLRERGAASVPGRAGDPDLRRALARLPREARLLVILHYSDGLSYGELARVRGISINTVRSQLQRARALLRAHLRGRKETNA